MKGNIARFASHLSTICIVLLTGVLFTTVSAQVLPNFPSTTINPDHSITFRYRDPGATAVLCSIETSPSRSLCTRTPTASGPSLRASAAWHLPLPFRNQRHLFPRPCQPGHLQFPHAPCQHGHRAGGGPQLWDATAVPHGAVHHHTYTTAVVLGLPGNQSDYYVYTPPGYDPAGKPYPVLYLLHGWTRLCPGWLYNGRANFILDNLIAQGKVSP